SFSACCACAASGQAATAPPPSAASSSRRPMVTVIRPSRARCVEGTLARRERAVLSVRHPARAGSARRTQRGTRFPSSRTRETMFGRAVFSEGDAARPITASQPPGRACKTSKHYRSRFARPLLSWSLQRLSAEKQNEYQGQQEREGHERGKIVCR